MYILLVIIGSLGKFPVLISMKHMTLMLIYKLKLYKLTYHREMLKILIFVPFIIIVIFSFRFSPDADSKEELKAWPRNVKPLHTPCYTMDIEKHLSSLRHVAAAVVIDIVVVCVDAAAQCFRRWRNCVITWGGMRINRYVCLCVSTENKSGWNLLKLIL